MEKKTHTILLVEDEETHAELVCESLASAGDKFRVTVTGTLQQAKAALAETKIDIAIVDWSLPDGKGLELLPGSLDAATVPMVVMTSHGDEQLAVDAMKAGALDYIVKSSETLANMRHTVEHALREWEFIVERKRMVSELQRMERLESIGILAGGIAHDLNNFLTGLVGNIGLAKEIDDPVLRADRLDHAESDAMQIKNLTQQLLTFAKGGAPVTVLSDISQLLTETANFTLSGSNVSCDYPPQDDTCPVEIDEGQIRQVINNLIINAQQAMPGGGTIRVAAVNIQLDEEDIIPLAAGPYVKVSIEDNGVGIPEEDYNRVFDPFFSTKPKGSGLGLATSYSIINQHHGLITVQSEVGVGTRFDIYLPASAEEVLDRKDKKETGSIAGGQRILVMDDQESIRDIVVISLNQLGCEVVTSMDGAEAIEKYKDAMRSGCPFEAVILDLTIPGGMGGSETMKHLKEIDPAVTAIVVSGYSDDPIMTKYRDYGFKGAISKPYGIKDLRAVLHEVLKEGPPPSCG